MQRKLVIALDGPAGAGKTTIAKELSKKLGIMYLSTGALYRGLAYKCKKLGLDAKLESSAEIVSQGTKVEVKYIDNKQNMFIDGKNVTDFLSTDEISEMSSIISTHKVIREKLLQLQRQIASEQSVIIDGRDIGSVVLPMADYKFYLSADVNVRAQRRWLELSKTDNKITFEEVLEDMKERDYRDTTRVLSPLKICDDAIKIDCTNLNIEQVVNEFIKVIEGK